MDMSEIKPINIMLRDKDAERYTQIKEKHDDNLGFKSKNTQFIMTLIKQYEDVNIPLAKKTEGASRYYIVVDSNLALNKEGVKDQLERGGLRFVELLRKE